MSSSPPVLAALSLSSSPPSLCSRSSPSFLFSAVPFAGTWCRQGEGEGRGQGFQTWFSPSGPGLVHALGRKMLLNFTAPKFPACVPMDFLNCSFRCTRLRSLLEGWERVRGAAWPSWAGAAGASRRLSSLGVGMEPFEDQGQEPPVSSWCFPLSLE